MDKQMLSGKDLLLAILYVPGINQNHNEPIIGRTKLTKMIFLFEKELYQQFFKDKIADLPNFNAYLFGPYSKSLFDDLNFFISIGLIQTEETDIPVSVADRYELAEILDESIDDDWNDATFENDNEEVELKYFLSENGLRYVEDKIWAEFSDNQKENLRLFKSKINSISLHILLKYVYNKYPDYTTKSVIADKYLSKDCL